MTLVTLMYRCFDCCCFDVVMRSFWSDPYLWIHLAGVAALPIFLEICFLGLAVGDPVLPIGLELLFVAAVGIAPIVWMQWQRPFYIFSLVAIALKPTQLSVEQRKLLRLFKAQTNRVLAVAVPVVLLWVLWQLYRYAPIAAEVTPLPSSARGLGLIVAAIAFLASNLFLQVPVSVAAVLLTRETTFAAVEPYPVEQIPTDFTLLGWRVKQIVPDLVANAPVVKQTVRSVAAPPEPLNAEPIASTEPVSAEPIPVFQPASVSPIVEPEPEAFSESISDSISKSDPTSNEAEELFEEVVSEEGVLEEGVSEEAMSEEVVSEPAIAPDEAPVPVDAVVFDEVVANESLNHSGDEAVDDAAIAHSPTDDLAEAIDSSGEAYPDSVSVEVEDETSFNLNEPLKLDPPDTSTNSDSVDSADSVDSVEASEDAEP